ncbi:cysteine--tRNA ligase [Methylocapsa sp. D3K7]|uniref:cysteine--tRNA ligase n=1 Tax=Methylocapsa sp. D3K7 TaxID=3041435 RepID=UPI00244E93EF|nr:cysteine--tRNA ligase [Methylocapsa sp. D3K7]WGJ13015.1 cysteine--tRNA ligase [Methylocapsa sp. D3K7]
MPLRLYNTLTRSKDPFAPIDAANVRLYACGPTVYDHLHIGNGRMLIVFDMLFRLLRHEYGAEHVTYVRNITDVDDKINARAAERGVDIRVLTDEMTAIFHEDVNALGCLPPTVEPRATDHIAQMIAMIGKLIANGHAYVADGHVLFDVPSMPAYGKLSKRPLDEMIAGARVEVAPYKRNPMDFVLWKPSSSDEPGWESPWGRGRPGWHIECSAMSSQYLGEVFDIHGGGIDLVFPHHENELAQSCSAFGHDVMANVWMHNGHLQVEGEKMSKSLGNFVTIHELLGQYSGTIIRYNMMKTHYRQPADWRSDELERSRRELLSFSDVITSMASEERYHEPDWSLIDEQLLSALEDDLNTPLAFARLHELAESTRKNVYEAADTFAVSAAFLGLKNLDKPNVLSDSFVSYVPDDKISVYSAALSELRYFKNFSSNGIASSANEHLSKIRQHGLDAKIIKLGIDAPVFDRDRLEISFPNEGPPENHIKRLIAARENARKNKNWAESDRIRVELDAMGIVLKDNKDGTTTWEPKR